MNNNQGVNSNIQFLQDHSCGHLFKYIEVKSTFLSILPKKCQKIVICIDYVDNTRLAPNDFPCNKYGEIHMGYF